MGEVTLLIERARGGSREAFERIFELLYPNFARSSTVVWHAARETD